MHELWFWLCHKKDGFEIIECPACELTYVSQILDDLFYEETYAFEEYASVVSMLGYESHPYSKERFGVERVRKLAQYWDHQESPCFLDIGCSTGFVVHAATERGWNARGIDLNQNAINFGKKKFDLKLSGENFFDINEHFDFIGMYDVLEHVPDPMSFLQQAFERLNRSGCIHIYVLIGNPPADVYWIAMRISFGHHAV